MSNNKPADAAWLPAEDNPHVAEVLAAAAAHHTELHTPVALDMSLPGSSAQCSKCLKEI